MGVDESTLAAASLELEKSIQEDKTADQGQDLGTEIVKSIKTAVDKFVSKGKGAPTSDLKADKDRRGTLLDAGKDPAENPKKSGGGYEDSSRYESRKSDDEEDMEDEDDDSSDKKLPAFFGKKGKKKVRKSYSQVEESDDEDEDSSAIDGTEFLETLDKKVEYVAKSLASLEEGMAIFGELLAESADPRRDALLTNIAKALTFVVTEQKEIKKSLQSSSGMMKSIAQLPGMPRIAGLQAMISGSGENAQAEEMQSAELSKADKDRLFGAAVRKQISQDEMHKALATRDTSILSKVK